MCVNHNDVQIKEKMFVFFHITCVVIETPGVVLTRDSKGLKSITKNITINLKINIFNFTVKYVA